MICPYCNAKFLDGYLRMKSQKPDDKRQICPACKRVIKKKNN